MNVYDLIIVTFAIAFVLPIAKCVVFSLFCIAATRFVSSHTYHLSQLSTRWLYIEYISHLFGRCINATIKLKKKLAARKSKFQEELDKIAAQYGVPSKELQV
jgi:hypothetical protein